MQKTVHSILSDNGELRLQCATRWSELTQEELRYVLNLIGMGCFSSEEIRTMLLMKLCRVRVLKYNKDGWVCAFLVKTKDGKTKAHKGKIELWQVDSMIQQLEFVNSYEQFDVRLESVGEFAAVDPMLHRVRFGDYLNMEKYYQGYMKTTERKYVEGLCRLLYNGCTEKLGDAELACAAMWFSYVKLQFSKIFKNFFRAVPNGKPVDWLDAMNAQLRALTDGDVTKEQQVLDIDTWRALTELDAKAREAEELKKMYDKNK